MKISPVDPIAPAFDRAAMMTFKPFDLGKWFVLGFIAWLAALADGGGASFNYSSSSRRPAPGPGPTSMPDPFADITNWLTANMAMAILIGLVILVAGSAFYVLVLWISSRGKFMFLRGIATNTAQVVGPWKEYRELGNSLFAFRACLTGASMLAMLLVAGAALMIALPDIQARTFGNMALGAVLLGAGLAIPIGLTFFLISWCTDVFVSIIMYATGVKVLAAWREFRTQVLPGNIGTIILFLLMQIVLGIAAIIAQFLVGCATCCLGFLPYLSTVVTLPVSIFMRSYSIYFLQQFGPRYVIIQEMVPPPRGGFPVTGMDYPPFPPMGPPATPQ